MVYDNRKDIEIFDAAIFSGDILDTHIEQVEEALARWQRAINEHKNYKIKELKETINKLHAHSETSNIKNNSHVIVDKEIFNDLKELANV